MPGFSQKPLTEPERWVSQYESFVAELRDGYSMSVYEYTNDLSCRDRLEAAKETPEVAAMWARVERSDDVLRGLLLPTKRGISGDRPRSQFWYWGYPPGSPELEADLRSRGAI